MTLLGSPVLKDTAQDAAISHKIDELRKAVDRLSPLQSHDALVLLNNSLTMPKLLYTLRSSDCNDSPLLAQFDGTLRQPYQLFSTWISMTTSGLELLCQFVRRQKKLAQQI